jgi:hypothetical protein
MARTVAPERTAAGTRINVTAQGRKWQTVAPTAGTLRFVGNAPTVTKTGA